MFYEKLFVFLGFKKVALIEQQKQKKMQLSLHAKDFIIKCLEVDLNKRLSANQLFEHPLYNERLRQLQISGSFILQEAKNYINNILIIVKRERMEEKTKSNTIERNSNNNYFNPPAKPNISYKTLLNTFYKMIQYYRICFIYQNSFLQQQTKYIFLILKDCSQEKLLYFILSMCYLILQNQ
ncbi:unnamed protein product [Paramecium sonneborni]|uniref:Uncharacterized protein n=1 Tax=Paramecium sonneborni TaxID=65129 RepID=A0A8S1MDM6_9CILI|nr:unnamed protein product [Paramecium sonneborni]